MPDTHINAYFGAVDEAKKDVIAAKAKLAEAESALEVKKKQVGWVEEKPAEEEKVVPAEQPVQQSKDSKKK